LRAAGSSYRQRPDDAFEAAPDAIRRRTLRLWQRCRQLSQRISEPCCSLQA
jgi:hypothetical protein